MLLMLVTICIVALGLGYFIYGKYVENALDIDPNKKTPAVENYDGIDYCPAKAPILMGHHFSSIAGAGPIVGPILAALAFGWAPVMIWIVIGAIFIGGVHDYTTLVASIRYKARSIAQIAQDNISPLAYRLFLIFIYLALIYVLIVFLDLTAGTFTSKGEVATSSIFYIALAIVFGICIYKFKFNFLFSTIIFVGLVFIGIYLGNAYPVNNSILADKIPSLTRGLIDSPANFWRLILLFYCFVASITPVWILLQPRDYLSSFLLYACLFGGLIGLLIGGYSINYPALIKTTNIKGIYPAMLIPGIFITVACGACSGFHSIVSSGTTAKQLARKLDARPVAYGSMLIEGVLAIIALAIVMICVPNSGALEGSPIKIFAIGLGNFLSKLGINTSVGETFGLLALSAFLLTTLDTATRLARFIFEELFNLKFKGKNIVSTLITLILPAIIVFLKIKKTDGGVIPAWKAIWPVFGATNQLLAGLALLVISVWLYKNGKKFLFTLIPMIFMVGMTLYALILLGFFEKNTPLIKWLSIGLLILGMIVVFEAIRTFKKNIKQKNVTVDSK